MIALASELGVPFDEACRWSEARRTAALVALGELRGGRFDWNRMHMNWPKP